MRHSRVSWKQIEEMDSKATDCPEKKGCFYSSPVWREKNKEEIVEREGDEGREWMSR